MLADSYGSDRFQRRRPFLWPPLPLGAIAFYVSYAVGEQHFWWSFGALVVAAIGMYAPDGPYFAFVRDAVPDRMAGTATGLVNAFGGLGGFAGAYFVGWLTNAGAHGAAFLFMAASQLAAALLILAVRPRVRGPVGRGRRDAAAANVEVR